jgi:putative aminopeptidase FrvX
MHTTVETVSLGDLADAARLIVAALERITNREEFIPA